ncbi:hypothetical protein J5690_01740 [bacterium]|nr:hypothetical protein [bacterium]
MSDSNVNVNTESLRELTGSLGEFSSSVAETLNEANGVISEYLDRMKCVCEQIRKKWEEAREKRQAAENEWNEAESEHSACLASQEQDEDGNWHPSCYAESMRAAAARAKFQQAQREENEKRQIYENAVGIVNRAKGSIDEYKCGSGAALAQIAGDYSQAARSEIGIRLEQLGEILDTNLSLDSRKVTPRSLYPNSSTTEPERPREPSCQKCGRPISKCFCQRQSPAAKPERPREPYCSVCGYQISKCICKKRGTK